MKKLFIPIIVILIIAAGIGAFFVFQKPAFPDNKPVPKEITTFEECIESGYPVMEFYPRQCKTSDGKTFTEKIIPVETQNNVNSVFNFVMIHFEVGAAERFPWYADIAKGSDTRNLKYQQALWPTAIELVNLANKYNAKLTLAFTPQWAEYIMKDEKRVGIVREWQRQGHEIAYHHHGLDHPDWDGYSNRIEAKARAGYRGTAEEGFDFLRKLAYPESVSVGTITDTSVDIVDEIKVLTKGGAINDKGIDDLIDKPKNLVVGNKKFVILSHGFLETYYYNDLNHEKTKAVIEQFKNKYEEAQNGDIVGIVTHGHDYYRYPSALEEWLKFIQSKNGTVEKISDIVADIQ